MHMDIILFCLPKLSKLYFKREIAAVQRYFGDSARVQTVENEIGSKQLKKLIKFWNPSGAIVASATGYGVFTKRNLNALSTVYLDPPSISTSTFNVIQDNTMDAKMAAMELLSPEIRHYAFVSTRKPYRWSAERKKAFITGLHILGHPCSSFERRLPEGDYLKALADWLSKLPKPCGIFAANDITAETIVEVCSSIPISIPEEIKLVGCDNNIQICENASTPISSVCIDYDNAGLLCAQQLDKLIKNPSLKPTTVKYLPTGVVRRVSSAPVLKFNRYVSSALKLLHAKSCTEFPLSDIAAELGCSNRLLQMRFKSAIGTTIKGYMSEIRMARVKTMLKNDTLTIRHIAKACGYGTETALRIAFRKKNGMSMSEWRRLYLASR